MKAGPRRVRVTRSSLKSGMGPAGDDTTVRRWLFSDTIGGAHHHQRERLPATRASGALLALEVTAAMQEAAQYCVDMAEIQAAASKIIAEATGAEAGIITRAAGGRTPAGRRRLCCGPRPGQNGAPRPTPPA